jgi:rhodanese-related sulfurtransferase
MLNHALGSSSSSNQVAAASNPRDPKRDANTAASSPSASAGFGSASNPFLNVAGNSIDCTEDEAKGPEPPMIHTAEAEKLFHQGARFVDVRSADDFGNAHIHGAENIPLLEAQRRATELPRDKTIVLYESGNGGSNDTCAASRSVGRVLLGHGYNKVVVYQDGLAGWQKQALPTEPAH